MKFIIKYILLIYQLLPFYLDTNLMPFSDDLLQKNIKVVIILNSPNRFNNLIL